MMQRIACATAVAPPAPGRLVRLASPGEDAVPGTEDDVRSDE